MSAERLEAFLAKIYVDESSRERFLADPRGEAAKAGLSEREIEALEKIDRVGLILATRSLQKKRQRLSAKRLKPSSSFVTSVLSRLPGVLLDRCPRRNL